MKNFKLLFFVFLFFLCSSNSVFAASVTWSDVVNITGESQKMGDPDAQNTLGIVHNITITDSDDMAYNNETGENVDAFVVGSDDEVTSYILTLSLLDFDESPDELSINLGNGLNSYIVSVNYSYYEDEYGNLVYNPFEDVILTDIISDSEYDYFLQQLNMSGQISGITVTSASGEFYLYMAILDAIGDNGGQDTNTNPVPEPATLFLVGSGLIGLTGMSRKKRNSKQ